MSNYRNGQYVQLVDEDDVLIAYGPGSAEDIADVMADADEMVGDCITVVDAPADHALVMAWDAIYDPCGC